MEVIWYLTKPLLTTIALMTLIPSMFLTLLAAGAPVPPKLYMWLSSHIGYAAPALTVASQDAFLAPSPDIEAARDRAFELLNIRPEARKWMGKVHIQVGSDREYSGWYDPTDKSISISQPYVQVFLHEFAHANFDHRPIWDRTAFAANAVRLYFDSENYPDQSKALGEVLAIAVFSANRGEVIDIVQEIYASVAESSKGDLRSLPDYLQPYYDDYLQPSTNEWMVMQAKKPSRNGA